MRDARLIWAGSFLFSLGERAGADHGAPAQKYTSGMTAKTEQTLAERAGHLEMLGGGKKDRGKGGGAGAGGGAKAVGAKAERRKGAGGGGGGKG